ncbi:MAG: GspJ family type II secretion system protein [Bdellovibrionaceae bacterium]|nr:GspJ family type II secretion system protein [Pseudobdellovibrionaceae bacterium]
MIKTHQGFTLLEIIISVAILAFISVFTATSIQNAIKSKVKVVSKIEETSYVQDALKVIAEDIRLAFHHKDINIELFNLAQDERKKRAEQKAKEGKKEKGTSKGEDPPADPVAPITEDTAPKEQKTYNKKEEKKLTQFLGLNESLDFTCLCNTRTVEDSPFSDQAEVGYSLEDCRGRLDKRVRSRCLWRRISPIIDEDIKEGGTKRVLLENVESLKFRYIGPESEEDWKQSWQTNENGDDLTQNKFPYAVEITIEMKPKKEGAKAFAMTIVAPLSFPNNQKTTEERLNEQKEDTTKK